MKNKKIIITVITIFIVITVIIISYKFINKGRLLNNFINDISNMIINKFDYETVSGDIELKVKADCISNDKNIISDMKYFADYEIDFNKGYVNIDGNVTYNKEKLKNNIYINNSSIYILTNDVYEKYVSFDAKYLYFLNHFKEYKKIIAIFNEVINELLDKNYYILSTDEFNGKKVNKTVLNLNGNNYSKIRKRLIDRLVNNSDFIKNLSKYKELSKKETIEYIKNVNFEDYQFILYTTKFSNNFVGFEFHGEEIDLIITYNKNNYFFEYYERDGLLYQGNIKIKGGDITEIYLEDIIKQVSVNLEKVDFNIEYNKEVDANKIINDDNVIGYESLFDKDKETIKKNTVIIEIYNNYSDRFNINNTINSEFPSVEDNEEEAEEFYDLYDEEMLG